ncbi:MAG: hypothetical protein KGZ83_13840 [Sulfuricella sp.]|nr:hypothetical protein [Sulfuricella sp.]
MSKTTSTWINRLLALLFLVPATLHAAESDSGMITLLQGGVSYASGTDKGKPAAAFMKLRSGDKLTLANDARIQLVYFSGGRQETWRGAAQLEIGSTESRSALPGAQPEVRQLPAIALQQLTRAPNVMNDLKNRTGMVMVRALPTREKLRELDDTYAALRKDAAAEDVTPELYLLSGLQELKLYQDMKEVLEQMRQRQPDNPEVQAIYRQYSKLMGTAEGKGK